VWPLESAEGCMWYLKGFFFNFLTVFFANHILPGIQVVDQTKLPHLGSDLGYALVLGFLNASIYPIMKLIGKPFSWTRIAVISLILNFVSYALLFLLPIGIHLESFLGYCLASLVVSVGGFLTNFLEMKRDSHSHQPPEPPLEE